MIDGVYGEKFISSLIELPLKILATYFTLYALIDRFLMQKKYTAFLQLPKGEAFADPRLFHTDFHSQ